MPSAGSPNRLPGVSPQERLGPDRLNPLIAGVRTGIDPGLSAGVRGHQMIGSRSGVGPTGRSRIDRVAAVVAEVEAFSGGLSGVGTARDPGEVCDVGGIRYRVRAGGPTIVAGGEDGDGWLVPFNRAPYGSVVPARVGDPCWLWRISQDDGEGGTERVGQLEILTEWDVWDVVHEVGTIVSSSGSGQASSVTYAVRTVDGIVRSGLSPLRRPIEAAPVTPAAAESLCTLLVTRKDRDQGGTLASDVQLVSCSEVYPTEDCA